MTDSDYTVIAFVIDRSGSMGGLADPPHTKAARTTEGVHDIVRQQRKEPGRCEFVLTDFDTDGIGKIPLNDGGKILEWSCSPRSGTPLLDALGTTITGIGKLLSDMPEDKRPGRVIFVIGTDGEENSSQEYSKEQVGQMIEHQKDAYGWDFTFIGAGFDAFDEAGGIGIGYGQTLSASPVAMAAAYLTANVSISNARNNNTSVTYTEEQRTQVDNAGR